MKKLFTKIIIKLLGWKVINTIPSDVKKCVVMMAPHTSNWDFMYGWLGYASIGINSKYLIKKEAFAFPLGIITKVLGGIPVDRKSSNNVVHQVSELFGKNERLLITIAPEGTRSLNFNWKRGFYYIAEHAGVPIGLGFLDYKNKIGGVGKVIIPSGSYEADLKIIEEFYAEKHARYPENFSLSPQNRKVKSG